MTLNGNYFSEIPEGKLKTVLYRPATAIKDGSKKLLRKKRVDKKLIEIGFELNEMQLLGEFTENQREIFNVVCLATER